MSKYIASIDQGTTSSRCILFDKKGNMVASHQLEHEQICPQAGWVEHDPMEILKNTNECIKKTLEKAGVTAADIAGAGITNQRETTVVWNKKTGKPYHNALVWQDTRTDSICDELAQTGGQNRFKAKVGLPLATYFSGPKIKWLLDNVDGLRKDAENGDAIFGNIDTWLIWNLTEGNSHITDVTNASRTMLMDLKSCSWDDEILKIMSVPKSMMPEIRPSSDPDYYGLTKADGPFGGKVPLCGDLGDQQAAMVGQVCFNKGEAKNTYGTGCFMLINTGSDIVDSKSGLLTTVCYKLGKAPTVYALEGSIAFAGALVQWLRDNLKIISSAPEVDTLATTVEDNGGVYIVPAFSGLFAPYWRSDARGVITGLTSYAHKGHFARAALEATAYQTREVLDAMNADSGVDLKTLRVDGGMVVSEPLMQMQADILNVPVVRPVVVESTALGAAYAAGLAVGYWKDTDDLVSNWGKDKEWKPSADNMLRTSGYDKWKDAVQRTLNLA